MAVCTYCGKHFNISSVRADYNSEFNGLEYDDDYGEENPVCFDCALAETSAVIGTFEEMAEYNPHLLDD